MKVVKSETPKALGPKPIVFRGEHPDTRSDKEWVKYMVKKYPALDWMSDKQKAKLK